MSQVSTAVVPAKERVVRVSPKEAVIVSILLNSGREMYGYEIMKATKGEVPLASIYTMLSRLEDKGLVSSRLETVLAKGHAIPRRWYRVVPGLTLKGEPDAVRSKEGDRKRASAVSGLAAV
jgi:DNA-binding PadR family transcriptional regulator